MSESEISPIQDPATAAEAEAPQASLEASPEEGAVPEPAAEAAAPLQAPEPAEARVTTEAPVTAEILEPADVPAPEPQAVTAQDEATTHAAPEDDAAVPEAATTPAETEASAATTTSDESAAGETKAATPAKKRRRRTRAPRAPRAEEFVAPTPEDLEGIVSESVRSAIEQELPVGGKVIGWNQGGFHVVVDGIPGFCPRSSMELGAPREPAQYLDQEYLFRVLRVEEKGKRLVLSRAAVLIQEKRHQAEEARKKVQVGVVLTGKVVSLVDFGAFVDLGGVEGLIHVSEMRHNRVGHPSEVLAVGDEVEAKVIKLPKKGERASLSIRALQPSPWDGVEEKWPNGGKFTGKVMRKSEFGWFVELAPGVEGLLHASQLLPGMKEDDARLAEGATLEGWVREVDPGRHRISLSLREVPAGNPWANVQSRYPEGTVIKGQIERIAPFGAFILIEPGLTGLLPTSEMGLPRGASVGKAYPLGREVALKVAEVDPRRKRISLTRQEKTLEGSKADYQNYVKKTRKSEGMGALAAALSRLNLKSPGS